MALWTRRTPVDVPDWLEQARTRRRDALDWWEDRWETMEINYRYYAGKIFTAEQKDAAARAFKHLLEFNDYPTVVNSATGREAVNRYRPALRGRERGKKDPEIAQLLEQRFGIVDVADDPSVAQAMTEVIRWIEQACDADSEISDAFLDTFLCGLGNTQTYLDTMDGIDGKLKTVEVSPWDIAWDVDAKKRNMEDAMYLFAFRWVSLEEAMVMFPKKADELAAAAEDTRFHVPEKGRHKQIKPSYQRGESGFFNPHTYQVELTDYQFKQRTDRFVYEDPENGIERDVELAHFRRELRRWRVAGIPEPAYDRIPQWAHRRAWFAGDKNLSDDPMDLPIPRYTYSCITCYPGKSPRGTVWFCPGDLGRDPEKWRSKFLSLWLDILGSSPKAPIIMDRTAVKAHEMDAFREELSRPEGAPVADNLEGIKFGPGPNYATGMQPLVEYATSGIWSSMGMSPLSAGILDDPRRAPFQTVNAVMQAGQSVYAMPFDSLRFHRRELAKKYLYYIRDYVDPKIVLRAVGHDHVPAILGLLTEEQMGDGSIITWDKNLYDGVMMFDLIADEAPVTPNAAVAALQVMTQTDLFSLLQASNQAPPLEVLLDMLVAVGGISTVQKELWLSNPSGIPQEAQQALIQQVIAQLSPELQQAVMAEIQAPATAEEAVQA